MPKICDFETCRKFANYGESYCKPIRCREHKGEYKIANMLCTNDGCKIIASYNFQGLRSKFCFEHKTNEMEDIKNKKCIYQGCKLQSCFNYDGEKNGLYCSVHKEINMINIKRKKCVEANCNIIPTFNYDGEKVAKYCKQHKNPNMINVTRKTCEYTECKKAPNYNYVGEISGVFCAQHRLQNMVNINAKSCEYIDCKKIPNYNFSKDQSGRFCKEHCLSTMVDVINKSCEFTGCIKQPCYNFIGESKAIFCSQHKYINMVDVHNPKCKSNFCLGSLGNKKYKGYCSSCYQQLFPTDPLTLQMRCKTKEIAVRDFINLNFEGFQHDKSLWTGNCDCTHRRRLDHRKLIGNTLLCIETDENQHKNYDLKDEEIRYDDLYMLHGGKFVYIRFNPDKFKDKNGKSVNPMLYTRLPILKEEIEKQINRIENEENKELLEIIKLYYDEIKN
jgi:hypothetical protein